MPSSPKIKKEDMLKAALDIVIKDGYTALNIKAVADKLKCSTAPISWQFQGMNGFRSEFIQFAEHYLADKYKPVGKNETERFEHVGRCVINMAFDEPNLFKFFYSGEGNEHLPPEFALLAQTEHNKSICRNMALELEIDVEQASDFFMVMTLYTQGVGSMIASGLICDSREHAYNMLHKTGVTYLRGLGVKQEKILMVFEGETE